MEDRLPALDGGHPPGGERPTVAYPVHLVQDRDLRVAGAEEVGVEGVHRTFRAGAIGDRSPGRHQGLGRDLAAEHPKSVLRRADATVEVDLERLEVEQIE